MSGRQGVHGVKEMGKVARSLLGKLGAEWG